MKVSKKGFSLIEVLVSLALINTAMLGLFLTQVKALQAVNDSFFRQIAIELSNDYLTQLRAENISGSELLSPELHGLWLKQVKLLLPVDDEILSSHYIVCFSSLASSCDGNTSALNIQVAWYSSNGKCINHKADNVCFYRVRAVL